MEPMRMFLNVSLVVLLLAANGKGQNNEIHKFEAAVLQVVETVKIPATAIGPIEKITVREGDMIVQSQTLATVEASDATVSLKEAKIELEIITEQAESDVDIEFAKKSRQVALTDYQRARESNQRYSGVVSDREMDRLKLLVEQSDAELKKVAFEKKLLGMQKKLKQAAVDKNQQEVDRHQIRSAIDGQVVEINKQVGEWVNLSDPILKVVRLDRLRVEEYLPTRIANQEILNSPALFQSGEIQLEGKVVFVSPEINPLNSTAMVWIEFKNEMLNSRPGMQGTVKILAAPNSVQTQVETD